jgi:OmpA-OmpF porin, OOP family
MKTVTAIGFFILSLMVWATPSTAEDNTYFKLSGGVNWMADADYDVPAISPIVLTSTQSMGPVVIGAIGKSFDSGLKLEGELSYRSNDFDDIKATGTTTVSGVTLTGTNVPVALKGDVTSIGLMGNVVFDFAKDEKFHPFILAGVGGAQVSINDASSGGSALVDDDDFVVAYQFGAGLNYDISDEMMIGISYRYFGTTNPEFTGSDGSTTFDMENQSHSVLLGITFKL